MTQTLAHHLNALPAHTILNTRGDLKIAVAAPFEEAASAIQPGGVFVARAGRSADGHAYIEQALTNGAVAIIGEQEPMALPVPYVQVKTGAAVVGWLAASYHNFPARDLTVIGVTGTDGKTTTSTLIHALLRAHTHDRTGLISTLAADFGGQSMATGLHVTTPSAPDVQRYLALMRDAGLSHVVLEMTSHGLAQGRLNGVAIDVAVYTNITHEHLDYHGTWEAYRDAKALMFRGLKDAPRKPNQPKVSVLNADDPSWSYLAAIPADQVITYGIGNPADVRATQIDYLPDGTHITLADGTTLHSHLFGRFNVSNVLAAVAVARALGVTDLQAGLAQVHTISGRMEALHEGQDYIAMVDFAHTPNALANALQTARQMLPADRRLLAVFGSAGLRDVEKRRLMAETSAQLADITFLTAEDPRTESLDDILAMMADGCRQWGGVEGETFFRVRDRGEALAQACAMARPGDMVIACGKGHEQSMCFGEVEYTWDDRDALRAALHGTPLRTLPTTST